METQAYFYVPARTDFEQLYGNIAYDTEAKKAGVCFCVCSVCSCVCTLCSCGLCACTRCKCEDGLPFTVRPSC